MYLISQNKFNRIKNQLPEGSLVIFRKYQNIPCIECKSPAYLKVYSFKEKIKRQINIIGIDNILYIEVFESQNKDSHYMIILKKFPV